MPKKSKRKNLLGQRRGIFVLVVVVVVVGVLGVIALHDGVFGVTPIKSINDAPNDYVNLQVTIKGNLTGHLTWYTLDVISIKDASGASILVDVSSYTGAIPAVGTPVVVQGEVEVFIFIPYIKPNAIAPVWVFP